MESISLNDITAANQHLTKLSAAVLAYIEITFMVEIQTSREGHMLLIPVQKQVDQALREAGYGPHLDAIYRKYGVKQAEGTK